MKSIRAASSKIYTGLNPQTGSEHVPESSCPGLASRVRKPSPQCDGVGRRGLRGGDPGAAAITESSRGFSEDGNGTYPTARPSHSGVIGREWNRRLVEIPATSYSLLRYSRPNYYSPRRGNNRSPSQWVSGYERCGTPARGEMLFSVEKEGIAAFCDNLDGLGAFCQVR